MKKMTISSYCKTCSHWYINIATKNYLKLPHRVTRKDLNALYIEIILTVESSVIGELIEMKMLMTVVKKLIKIDVKIRWEYILHEDLIHCYAEYGQGVDRIEVINGIDFRASKSLCQ